MGGERVVNHILWDPPRPGHLLQVYWDSYLGGRRQLARGGQQPSEGTSEVGAAD